MGPSATTNLLFPHLVVVQQTEHFGLFVAGLYCAMISASKRSLDFESLTCVGLTCVASSFAALA
jgi:hypothetical protein